MNKALNRRFYKAVSVAFDEAGFQILLDGRVLKTPGKLPLVSPLDHVAKLIAAEWDAQDEFIRPETMPVTRLLNVALELTPQNRDKLVAEARSYGQTDLLCYRADKPKELVDRQSEKWDPVLAWAAEQGVALNSTQSIQAISQPDEAIDQIGDYASSKSDLDLTLFLHLTAVYGSVVLAMAVIETFISGAAAFALSRLDSLYQIEQWGEDEEAAEIARNLEAEITALCLIIEGA